MQEEDAAVPREQRVPPSVLDVRFLDGPEEAMPEREKKGLGAVSRSKPQAGRGSRNRTSLTSRRGAAAGSAARAVGP